MRIIKTLLSIRHHTQPICPRHMDITVAKEAYGSFNAALVASILAAFATGYYSVSMYETEDYLHKNIPLPNSYMVYYSGYLLSMAVAALVYMVYIIYVVGSTAEQVTMVIYGFGTAVGCMLAIIYASIYQLSQNPFTNYPDHGSAIFADVSYIVAYASVGLVSMSMFIQQAYYLSFVDTGK